jgi:hypothetical protein
MDFMDFIEISSCVNYQEIDVDGGEVVILDPYDMIKKRVNDLASLPYNWDGYNGISALDKVCENVYQLLPMLNSTYIDLITDLFPNPNGTLTVEWETNDNEKISLEIGEYNYSFFVKYSDREPKFINGEDIIEDFKVLSEALGELFSEAFFNFIY